MVSHIASGAVEGRLDSAHDLAAVLAALQLREKDQKDQKVHCAASANGLKFVAQSAAKDVAVLGWMSSTAFREYKFMGGGAELHIKLPVAPLLNCLQIFSDRAGLVLRYPSGTSDELRCTLEEEGAVTECQLKTLALDEAPAPVGSFFAPGEPLSVFRPARPEAWFQALSEFTELDAPDVVLCVTLDAGGDGRGPRVVLRAQTITSDAEVELPKEALEDFELSPEAGRTGGLLSHRYLLTGVLAGCLRAAKDAKAVKVRFNHDGVMSNQFILRGRGQRDLFCESLVCPLADSDVKEEAPGGVGEGWHADGGGYGGRADSIAF